ncbi:MAG: 23S rRNA (pseudouridine(1915)-N(3))-methyltransferase RlmH [Candidatus Peribacteria bacterium]|jgi:23S rRNA (pseudouridine1915-N3)-methyltransferase|nr:23S rRNA (pseudouridine(1915)-N(3))-methyltransferase RlmH [Candidatus Peribacteria bacterium]
MYTILHISDSDKHFSSAIDEYTKRLGKQLSFESLKPFKDSNRDLVIRKETEQLIATISKKYANYQKILLIKEGKMLTTEDFHHLIQHKDCVFIIGGPYGVQRELFIQAFPEVKEVSFGGITLPHGLAKLVLVEQLYRSSTLESGKVYHY